MKKEFLRPDTSGYWQQQSSSNKMLILLISYLSNGYFFPDASTHDFTALLQFYEKIISLLTLFT